MVDVFLLCTFVPTIVMFLYCYSDPVWSSSHSHSIETKACYVMVLSNQQALEVIKQVNRIAE